MQTTRVNAQIIRILCGSRLLESPDTVNVRTVCNLVSISVQAFNKTCISYE
jgi:hypothetical protein